MLPVAQKAWRMQILPFEGDVLISETLPSASLITFPDAGCVSLDLYIFSTREQLIDTLCPP